MTGFSWVRIPSPYVLFVITHSSWHRLGTPVFHCPAPTVVAVRAQVPWQITVTESTLVAALPLEVAWWFVWRCGWQPAGWLLVMTNRAQLVAGLAVRAAAGTNIVWGMHGLECTDQLATDDLNPHAEELTRLIKICDGLPPVKWAQGRRTHAGRTLAWLVGRV